VDKALVEYFKCVGDVPELCASGKLSAEEGYFLFDEITCYGRCSNGSPSKQMDAGLVDVSHEVGSNGRPRLPFDVSEVVTNLQQERYQQELNRNRDRITAASVSRAVYYFLRPVLTVPIRKHLQKLRLSGWEKIPFPRWPVDVSVDRLVQRALAVAMKASRIEKIPFVWFWPDGASGCAIITHDVESERGSDFCGSLMDLDESFGLKASFQVVPERDYAARPLIEQVRSRGFEPNVHDLNHDGHLFRDRRTFQDRVARINRYAREFGCRGFRSGALYRNQQWFDRFEFSYDMSVPNVAHLDPQRGGCCTVMPYFIGNIVELPVTTIQDYSLFHILGDYSTNLWKAQIDLILKRNGLITVLTHPDYLIDTRARHTYQELLAHLCEISARRNVWMALPGDVDRWWRQRNAMSLVRRDRGWHVEGPGSERARVAHATLEDDRLVYTLDKGYVDDK
jgi:hypothetical protein